MWSASIFLILPMILTLLFLMFFYPTMWITVDTHQAYSIWLPQLLFIFSAAMGWAIPRQSLILKMSYRFTCRVSLQRHFPNWSFLLDNSSLCHINLAITQVMLIKHLSSWRKTRWLILTGCFLSCVCSVSQLTDMNEQEDVLLEQFLTLPQLKQIITDKEDLVKSIEELASMFPFA